MVNVVFLHPDLGIGGAERAVIDAALSLKSRNHVVHFVTAHHDKSHCFQETKDGSLDVTAVGDWLPRSIMGKCHALCAYLRMIYAAVYLVFFSSLQYDIVFCDQISACIPVLKFSKARILFYCHFPDMLLTKRKGALKRLYRAPIDWLEEKTTGMADCVLVNSRFTAGIFKETFTSLVRTTPEVLYPIPDFSALDKQAPPPTGDLLPQNASTIFLSINRYERKKNLSLAIDALACLKEANGKRLNSIHLVMAGGYDERVVENREYYLELKQRADDAGIAENVTFIRSFSDAQKRTLLHNCSCLLYTPDREHFGIVPIEAMYLKCPVIAVKSGGPLETVGHETTGFLCKQNDEEFASAMMQFIKNKDLHTKMGEAGRSRVLELFSFEAFTNQLEGVVKKLSAQGPRQTLTLSLMWTMAFVCVLGLLLVYILF
ncbi:alpha-1,3/1,6-mannosyltransferase ALG2-like [Mizuhopecten yessoensis]|uniref:Alpha-1,3/1,6-mannosyltransferase ALG2 n=1 Tax=Mizuhopecten yessoensis TaxID=6573 RepID=A0A210R3K7_MIZYE|nr:alpha-1,3/1,6-mannosyltransferase ALG2-like [Mizuhopecten yessoensis]OWF55536.1 Alpha-1,3/1,6-mannosyltransferase ALG2 [Mizuhopecten yessoensis]